MEDFVPLDIANKLAGTRRGTSMIAVVRSPRIYGLAPVHDPFEDCGLGHKVCAGKSVLDLRVKTRHG